MLSRIIKRFQKSDSSFHAQLRALLELIFTTNASMVSPHFTLLMAHTLRALTHLRMGVRIYALTILTLLMRTYPGLCRNSTDLYDSFVEFLNSKRIPANRKVLEILITKNLIKANSVFFFFQLLQNIQVFSHIH